MQATDTSAIRRLIGQARFRIRAQWALDGATSGLILATANALIAVWLLRTERVGTGTGIALLLTSLVFVIGGALISAFRHLDDETIARKIDRASGLSDRLSTAIAFQRTLASGTPPEDGAETEDLMVAAIKDGVRAAARANVPAATPYTAPSDWKAAAGFLVLSALVAGLAIERPDRMPGVRSVDPDHARPGEIIHIRGKNLLTGIASPVATLPGASNVLGAPGDVAPTIETKSAVRGFVPTDGSVYLGPTEDARPIQVIDWTKSEITVRVPDDAKPGDTQLVVYIGKKAYGPLAFTVVRLDDDQYKKEGAVLIDPEERAYIEGILKQLREVAKRDNVPELEEFAKTLEELLKQAEDGKITKEQLLEALQKAEEALSAKSEPNQAEINKAMSEMGKELSKENITKELGKALEKNDLQKAKEELEKLAAKLDPEEAKKELEELKKQLENKDLTEQEKKDLQKKIDELKKQLEDPKLTDKQKEELQKKIDELKKQLEDKDHKLTEQQKQELQKQIEKLEQQKENKDLTPQQKQDMKEQLEQLEKEMENKDLTPQQKEELQKKMEALKDQKPMTEQEKQKLQQQLEQVSKQMEQKNQKQEQQQQQQQQKLEKQIRELQKKKDEAKNEKDKVDAERELQKKKDELEKLKKDQDDKNQSAQREALKRLERDMKKAAENLDKPQPKQNQSKDERDEEEKERDKQASRNLKDAARETGRVDQDQRKQAAQKKMSSQMDDLREAMRRAKQKGNKGPSDPFNKGNKNKDFQARARGQKGSGQAWKPGQGQQPGQGQGKPGQGQPGGQGNQPGGKQWGTGTGPDVAGDPTNKSGNTKDEDLQGVSGKGSSRRETILSAAQKGFASTSYQKVYADYEKIVEEVMRNEKLPSSYKYYVKRYFAKIHPNTGNTDTAPTAPQAQDKQ